MNFSNILTTVLAAIGFALAFYFYSLSENEREPVFVVDPDRPLLVEANSIMDFPLKIVDANGNALKKNVSSVRFYFWNAGDEAIKNSHVLKPILVNVMGPDNQIIDIRVLTATRSEITAPKLELVDGSHNSISLKFDILEKGDGFAAQIIYAGDEKAVIKIDGALEGVKQIKSNDDIATVHVAKRAAYRLGRLLLTILVMLGFGIGFFWIPDKVKNSKWYSTWYETKWKSSFIARKLENSPRYVRFVVLNWFSWIMFIVVIVSIVHGSWQDYETLSVDEMARAIPPELRNSAIRSLAD